MGLGTPTGNRKLSSIAEETKSATDEVALDIPGHQEEAKDGENGYTDVSFDRTGNNGKLANPGGADEKELTTPLLSVEASKGYGATNGYAEVQTVDSPQGFFGRFCGLFFAPEPQATRLHKSFIRQWDDLSKQLTDDISYSSVNKQNLKDARYCSDEIVAFLKHSNIDFSNNAQISCSNFKAMMVDEKFIARLPNAKCVPGFSTLLDSFLKFIDGFAPKMEGASAGIV